MAFCAGKHRRPTYATQYTVTKRKTPQPQTRVVYPNVMNPNYSKGANRNKFCRASGLSLCPQTIFYGGEAGTKGYVILLINILNKRFRPDWKCIDSGLILTRSTCRQKKDTTGGIVEFSLWDSSAGAISCNGRNESSTV